MTDQTRECKNTDRELWREADDYYANSIRVTERGGIGINVGGTVIVKPLAEWHRLASAPSPEPLREALEEARRYIHETITTRARREVMLASIAAALAASPLSVETVADANEESVRLKTLRFHYGSYDLVMYAAIKRNAKGEDYFDIPVSKATLAALRSSGIDGGE